MTPEQRFAALVATDAARPFVTYYDEATGERSELSVRSLANWVAKTHYLLTDELGLGTGDTALVSLPAHWLSIPVLLGCLTAGLALSDGADDSGSDVAFVTAETIDDAEGMLDVYAINAAQGAAGFGPEAPGGAQDYVTAVRPQADAWGGVQLRAGDADALVLDRSRGEVDAIAVERAAELGLPAGGRLLTATEWTSADDWLDAVFAPLAVGGSVVIVRHADAETMDRRATQERTTTRLP